jgi:PIN domain
MPSIDDAAVQIAASGVPVLFLDTCILLDMIRSTSRYLTNDTARALELSVLASAAPPACLVVVSSIVPHEWNANAQKVTEENARYLERLEEHSRHFHDACHAFGIALPFGRAGYSQSGLAERLRDLSKRVLDQSVCLDADAGSRSRAVERVIRRLPPSRKSGEVKDSAIIEDYMAVCRSSRTHGFTRKCVFCSSNPADYCETGGRLHPALDAEFIACGLTFTTNLPWAVHEITH